MVKDSLSKFRVRIGKREHDEVGERVTGVRGVQVASVTLRPTRNYSICEYGASIGTNPDALVCP